MTESTTTGRSPGVALLDGLRSLGPLELGLLRRAAGEPLGSDVAVYDIFRALWHTVRREHPVSKWVAYCIARLYPWHPQPGGKGTLGQALRRIRPPAAQREARQRADQRFTPLLDCREQQAIFGALAAAIRSLARAHVAVHWARLFDDLQRWHRQGQPIQQTWADDYFTH